MIQALTGVAYPFTLAPVASFMFATRHFTYRLPSITEKPMEIIKLWLKFTKSASSLGGLLLALNVFVAMFMTSKEMSEMHNISRQLQEIEKKVDAGLME